MPPAPSHLVETTASDRFFDYCLQPYEPRRSPVGKLRSESLLWQSLDVGGACHPLRTALQTVLRECGRDMTVFGVKHAAGVLSWELYFYDPQKQDVHVTATAVQQTVAPYFRIDAKVDESIPYFMFSFNVDPDTPERGVVDDVNLYLASYQVQGGRSYKLAGDRMELENFYRFYHPKREIEELVDRVKSSAFVDFGRVSMARVLRPELFACNRVCVANKRTHDGIYYSGIDVDQLLFFFGEYGYPEVVSTFVRSHRDRFDHLRFDIGIDYRMDATGALVIPKTSYYGTV